MARPPSQPLHVVRDAVTATIEAYVSRRVASHLSPSRRGFVECFDIERRLGSAVHQWWSLAEIRGTKVLISAAEPVACSLYDFHRSNLSNQKCSRACPEMQVLDFCPLDEAFASRRLKTRKVDQAIARG